MGFSRHEWPLMCQICFSGLTSLTCATDTDGVKWDACKGICASEMGIEEDELYQENNPRN